MNDKEKVRQVINSLYNFSGIQSKYTGDINPKVAELVGQLLKEINTCSTAFSWVPRPTGGKATIAWVAQNVGKSVLAQLSEKQSLSCARVRVGQFQRPLQLAGLGI
ncbi:hypothetical protein [Thalassotalea piscium]|uniref:Uncharacterized protein n=1 Tax=Thalassotalea piscium TaxID=1230533 RepID=A0A7X0NK82_9GAMM|nr:hypothetical protein [Thalassotalea piscium]MBB6544968.1 hypothetical protein [Thalassotalea piscium]